MKKRVLNFVIILISAFLMFSCVIKQDIYFNRDFSGSYKYTYDFTEYVGYMDGEEESDSMMMTNEDFEVYLQSVVSSLKAINGINDVKFLNDADAGVVYFSYNFDNVEALNGALKYSSYMDQEPLAEAPYFELKKKKLTFIRHAQPFDEDEGADATTEEDDYMNEMFKWEFNIEFARDVKKFDVQEDTAITVSRNKRKFTEDGNVFDVAEKESRWEFKLK